MKRFGSVVGVVLGFCLLTGMTLRTSGNSGGSGDALVSQPLSQFASTSSNQLAMTINNETGTGLLVFGTNPVLTTPTLTTPTIASFANAVHAHTSSAAGGTLGESALALTDITTNDAPITASTGTFSTSISAPKVSNLTSNGFVKTSGSDGTLSVETNAISTEASAPKVLKNFVVDTTTTGTAIETLASYTMPGGTLSTDGDYLHITAWLSNASNGNSKAVSFVFGGTTVLGLSGSENGLVSRVDIFIYRTSATTQKTLAWRNYAASGFTPVAQMLPTETLSGSISILIRGTTAVQAGDLTLRAATITKYPAQ